ncbi:5-oxoprolinase subunit C family protein [Amycolatopsis aidingensis]|uniref:5-oxoprolinase subunit C family protein n=1 Tax=Amycolatopsis aidingensis TaxID=2842453 RepID=UPI001E54FC47|nr:biotin-dependent carboxyltransferase family protein [Amycolatopsis aidingensis]
MLEVLETGPLATVQDLGRPGYAHIGVGTSGAADRGSLRLANRLVGNPEGAAGIEVTLGGLTVRADRQSTIAVTGASCPVTVDGRRQAVNTVLRVPAGARLRLAHAEHGLRAYLAVRGGIAVEQVLGSRATDLLAGTGPPVLRPGTRLPIGLPPAGFPVVDQAPVPGPATGTLSLTVVPGPRADWFLPGALDTLLRNSYVVTPESNRVGIRLDGPDLPRARRDELPSEGMVAGAIQVPPSGRPTLFLADHPVTGGYPVIAVLVHSDVDKAAQARPGTILRFRRAGGPRGSNEEEQRCPSRTVRAARRR